MAYPSQADVEQALEMELRRRGEPTRPMHLYDALADRFGLTDAERSRPRPDGPAPPRPQPDGARAGLSAIVQSCRGVRFDMLSSSMALGVGTLTGGSLGCFCKERERTRLTLQQQALEVTVARKERPANSCHPVR